MADEPVDPYDPFDLQRPLPGGRWTRRAADRAGPWVAWFGVRRIIATVVTVVALVGGGWWLLRSPAPPTEAGLPFARGGATTTLDAPAPASSAVAVTSSTVPTVVVVDVAGAVAAPGVYELPAGARAQAAVAAAGGPAAGADLTALNLAAPLRDGQQVFVPLVGAPPRAAVPVAGEPADPGAPTTAAGPVDLNHATAEQLDALPGIGPSTAQAIVQHREQHGPFASVDELEDVRGIGPAKLDAIRGLVTL